MRGIFRRTVIAVASVLMILGFIGAFLAGTLAFLAFQFNIADMGRADHIALAYRSAGLAAVNALVATCALYVIRALTSGHPRRHALVCPRCGYDLTGIARVCPECGAATGSK